MLIRVPDKPNTEIHYDGDWVDALQDYHARHCPHQDKMTYLFEGNATVNFALLEWCDDTEPCNWQLVVSRWFFYGIGRKGGIIPAHLYRGDQGLEEIAKKLQWPGKTYELIEEGWEGEETIEEAERRRNDL